MDDYFNLQNNISIDALIEQFRVELSETQGEENTRTLTIEADSGKDIIYPRQDIEKQITDLENLIKKMQEEIEEINNNANKPIEDSILKQQTKISEPVFSKDNIIYPVVLSNIHFNLSKDTDEALSRISNISKTSKILDTVPEIPKEEITKHPSSVIREDNLT